ncbi:MAG: hypothetical protein QOK47_1500 [Actinomycetota bacterium]|nr:hypothetical protein [Actinomycetota bacterium]
MNAPKPGPHVGLVVIGSMLKWSGLFGMVFGLLSSAVAVRFLFSDVRPGQGELTDFEPMIAGVNKLALGLLLGAMFFTLAGSGLLLISRPLVPVRSTEVVLRWPRFLSYLLYVYSAAVLGLAVVLIRELTGAASGRVVGGLVAYCVMVAIGLLISSWGLKRFADVG